MEPLVSEKSVSTGVAGLLALVNKNEGKALWDENHKLFIEIAVHRIPTLPDEKNMRKTVKVPHPIWPKNASICFIVKDVKDTQEETIEEFQEILKENGITKEKINIDTILPYDQLKKDYKGFEKKRKLCQNHDLFLADCRVNRFLSSHLGKEFFDKRKMPMQIRLEKNLEKEINSSLRMTQFIITSRGVNLNVHFGNSSQDVAEITENLNYLLSQLDAVIPRGFKNIKLLALKSTGTLSIPIYRNEDVADEVNKMSQMEIDLQNRNNELQKLVKELKPKGKQVKVKKGKKIMKGKKIVKGKKGWKNGKSENIKEEKKGGKRKMNGNQQKAKKPRLLEEPKMDNLKAE